MDVSATTNPQLNDIVVWLTTEPLGWCVLAIIIYLLFFRKDKK